MKTTNTGGDGERRAEGSLDNLGWDDTPSPPQPLHYQIRHYWIRDVATLLEKLSSEQIVEQLKTQDENGETVLYSLVQKHDMEKVAAVLAKLSSEQIVEVLKIPNIDFKSTALHSATFKEDMMSLLVERLAPAQKAELFKIQDNSGNTPLHNIIAATCMTDDRIENIPLERVSKLLEGIPVDGRRELLNIQNTRGWTTLHAVAIHEAGNAGEAVELLLREGADPTIRTNDRKTAADLAKANKDSARACSLQKAKNEQQGRAGNKYGSWAEYARSFVEPVGRQR